MKILNLNRLTLAGLLTILTLCSVNISAAADLRFESGGDRVALVELYTSEGCSSCPPAERYMSTLLDDRKLWDSIVPIAFHVDYWDYIGWKDRFATPAYTERQHAHAWRLGMRTVYTPGFFHAGDEWRHWRRSRPADASGMPGKLVVDVKGEAVTATFVPTDKEIGRGYSVHIALLGFDLKSSVKAGENSGRTLEHDFVVLGHNSGRMKQAVEGFESSLQLPKAVVPSERTAIAAWVSRFQDTDPIQATGGWLKLATN